MKGKDKCNLLKQVRAKIARENDIPWSTRECSHQGECSGTCPYCDSEVKKLERELEKRRLLGKAVLLGGVATSLVAGLTGCSLLDRLNPRPEPLEGDVAIMTSSSKDPEDDITITSSSPEVIDWMGEVEDEEDEWTLSGELEAVSSESYVLDGDVACPVEESSDE